MPYQKSFNFIFSLCLLLTLFTACEKDPVVESDEENVATATVRNLMDSGDADPQNSEGADDDIYCFEIVYPLEVSFPGGDTQTFSSDDELEDAIDAYYEANPETEEDPNPVYPVNVVLEDGTEQSINNDDELNELFYMCDDDDDDDDEDEHDYDYDDEFEEFMCFTFEYPITIIFPNQPEQEVNTDEEFEELILTWEATHSTSTDSLPTLDYPVEIILEDETRKTITNDDELEEAFDECYDYEDHGCDYDIDYDEDCFEIVFPITLQLGDDQQTAQTEDEIEDIIDSWLVANPDNDDDDIEIAYPVTIKYEDGTEATINSDDEFESADEACAD